MPISPLAGEVRQLLEALGVSGVDLEGGRVVRSPIDGREIAHVRDAGVAEASAAIGRAAAAVPAWRVKPAPWRGELVRRFGESLRAQ
jgi:aldehyde dehydrogenase (NAD+)